MSKSPPKLLHELLELRAKVGDAQVLTKLVMHQDSYPTFKEIILRLGGQVLDGKLDPKLHLGSVTVESSPRCPLGYVVGLDQHGKKMAVYRL